ncbi:MAG TPA: mannose-1-phosphate guanylyltransferase/mannose-6-phosphate isomerase [Methylophilus sp.]|nr:mannose-1-phosphate guanylyltransferase/mannose-6-phosphate isomerase [Methylophilus sp.]HQQ33511.1 mannose-1-phosphate guanylyltransferase/mannose-6-phosphate isomerase [Methylophilus sp.]
MTSYAVILCGGSGTRLWPLSRTMQPKQLLALNGKQTLLQQTAARLLEHVTADRLFTVTHEDHKFQVKGQLAELALDAVTNVLAEPMARNTLPAIAWATYQIYQREPDAIIGVFASDHAIDNQAAFLQAWQAAEQVAQQGYLVLLGIKPHEPATGYGYIKPSQKEVASGEIPVYAVEKFVEKPDLARAKEFLQQGFLWNSGMFVFKASAFMQMLATYQPEIDKLVRALKAETLAEQYTEFPNLSMDYGLAEKAEKVAVVPVDMAWSDLGSWDSLYAKRPKDDHGNVLHGDVYSEDTNDSLIWASRGVVATLGLKNVAVIQTSDATLVCDRSRAEDIKNLVTKVKNTRPELTEFHRTVHRPWGTYTVLEEGSNFKIKRIVVKPGAKLSMQMHKHRSEHWVVVSGEATITNGDMVFTLQANQSTYIPKTHRHRLANEGSEPLAIIEVQCGDYVGEDDIVRFDDTYGRVAEKQP